eukprot:SAG11_NODE_1248_length_5396_cov_2.091372_6_plen_55_part_00
MKMKLDLEQQNARLLEDKRRNDEDRANLERSTQQSTAEVRPTYSATASPRHRRR